MPCHHYTDKELYAMREQISSMERAEGIKSQLWNLQWRLSDILNDCRKSALWDQIPLESKQWMQWYETHALHKDTHENVYT
jgi:hypothetical protein